ncbi:MlaD family protein [Patulibacter sp. S7RM1-6]
MNKNRPKPLQILLMLGFALSCFGLLLFLWSSFGGPVPLRGKPYEVTAKFVRGPELASYADVRVSGITVGKVTRIQRSGDGATVRMKIDPEYAPLPKDTRATLRTKTLLGETFVDLSFGSRKKAREPGQAIADGGRIPGAQVERTTQLDQILDAFDEPTRRDLRRVIASLDETTRGRGKDINTTLATVGPTSESADALFDILNRQSGEIRSGTQDLGTTFAAIGRREGAIKGITRSGRQLLETTAGITPSLRETLRLLPAFLSETRRTMRSARETAGVAKPVVDELRPVTPLIRPALQQLGVLAPELRQALVELGPVIGQAREGLPALRRVLEAVGPVSDRLAPVSEDLLPIAEFLKQYRREVMVTFANAASATQATAPDSSGVQRSYLRIAAPINGETLAGQRTRNPANRFSPYPRAGELELAGTGRNPSFSCDHTSNPSGVLTGLLDLSGLGKPDCVPQQPQDVAGSKTVYPRLQPITPQQVRERGLAK